MCINWLSLTQSWDNWASTRCVISVFFIQRLTGATSEENQSLYHLDQLTALMQSWATNFVQVKRMKVYHSLWCSTSKPWTSSWRQSSKVYQLTIFDTEAELYKWRELTCISVFLIQRLTRATSEESQSVWSVGGLSYRGWALQVKRVKVCDQCVFHTEAD